MELKFSRLEGPKFSYLSQVHHTNYARGYLINQIIRGSDVLH